MTKHTFEIRKAVGFVPRFKRNIWLYAVLHNGHTVGYFETQFKAQACVNGLRLTFPEKRHDA